jgi:hypothetical protein
VVARLMMLVSPPRRLGVEEAGEWLRRELCSFTGAAGARSVALSRLADASARSSGDWGWLVELEFETAERARGATGGREWSRLVGDLRLLGMSPTVALVDGAEELAP